MRSTASTSRASSAARRRGSQAAPRAIPVVAMLLVQAGCAARPQPYPASRVASERWRAVSVACLENTTSDVTFPGADERLSELSDLVASKLEFLGYAVVGGDRIDEIWKATSAAMGGYYDPNTGLRNELRYREIRHEVRAELGSRLACDMIVIPHVALVLAEWNQGTVRWDGVAYAVGDSSWAGFGAIGQVPALSLWITIRDMEGREMYFATGGIQIVSKLDDEALGIKFKDVGAGELLTNPQQLTQAVETALSPFVAAVRNPTSSSGS